MTADFSGGHLSSDGGGALLFRELEGRCGGIERLAHCFGDQRDDRYVEHFLPALEKGDNPRFIVTNLSTEEFEARALYEDF